MPNITTFNLTKRPHQKSKYTEEQLNHLIKCSESPVYFAENFFYIQNIKSGRQLFSLYPFQKKFIDVLSKNRYVIALMSRQMGKCLHSDSRINVRNKKTGEVYNISIMEFYAWQKFRKWAKTEYKKQTGKDLPNL